MDEDERPRDVVPGSGQRITPKDMKRAPFGEIPDIAGPTAVCEQCGTSLGPMTMTGGLHGSIAMRCGCGNVLEVWPT